MTAAGMICRALKEQGRTNVAIGGLHPTALAERTMLEEAVDFVIEGEGLYTLARLLEVLGKGKSSLSDVPGLWYRRGGAIVYTHRAPLIEHLDTAFTRGAWELLPMQRYRAHNWHCFDSLEKRSPYAALYTSLGCPYSCLFCCINALFGAPGLRMRNPRLVVEEITELVTRYGVRHLKFIDEMFVLHEPHYMGIADLLCQRGLDLNIWAYARVDSVNPANLDAMKRAGINWLALGIESADPEVRDGATKRMRTHDIASVVRTIKNAGIHVMGNFIFGLPDDTLDSMRRTLELAFDLQCEYVNMYCAMAYPGSALFAQALKNGWELPHTWHGYSQHAYEMVPLPTRTLSAAEVLRFRDDAFHAYFSDERYLSMLARTFGEAVRAHVQQMSSVRLKRQLLGG
jgi:radical SAM superfamily enzyme YgiQ (UPF0313 family)